MKMYVLYHTIHQPDPFGPTSVCGKFGHVRTVRRNKEKQWYAVGTNAAFFLSLCWSTTVPARKQSIWAMREKRMLVDTMTQENSSVDTATILLPG